MLAIEPYIPTSLHPYISAYEVQGTFKFLCCQVIKHFLLRIQSEFSMVIEVGLARTALKLGLAALEAQPGQVVLVPDFICEVVLHPIKQLGLDVVSYKILDDLSPDWMQLDNIDCVNVFGIIMVHYFGQPQNIEKFQSFCKIKNIYLIEDNAHGFGGTYKGKYLGTFGDIGISSPRKILNIPLGGILYLKNEIPSLDLKLNLHLSTLQLQTKIFNALKFSVSRFRSIYKFLIFWKIRTYDHSDPYAFKEQVKADSFISFYEKHIIRKAKMGNISNRRRRLWVEWHRYLTEQGLRPVFSSLNEESCPWAIAFYTEDINQRNRLIDWSIDHKLPAFCWPSLPDEQIQDSGGLAFRRWEKMFCISLDGQPPKIKGN